MKSKRKKLKGKSKKWRNAFPNLLLLPFYLRSIYLRSVLQSVWKRRKLICATSNTNINEENMFRKLFLCGIISAAAFFAACQSDPTPLNSTFQPRDNRTPMPASAVNNSESNREMPSMNSMNSSESNRSAMNANTVANSANRPTNQPARNMANHSNTTPPTRK